LVGAATMPLSIDPACGLLAARFGHKNRRSNAETGCNALASAAREAQDGGWLDDGASDISTVAGGCESSGSTTATTPCKSSGAQREVTVTSDDSDGSDEGCLLEYAQALSEEWEQNHAARVEAARIAAAKAIVPTTSYGIAPMSQGRGSTSRADCSHRSEAGGGELGGANTVGDGVGCRTMTPPPVLPVRGFDTRTHGARSLLVLDWDDTLSPTTWIGKHGLTLQSPTVPDELRKELDAHAKKVVRTLDVACDLGRVIIVTNAERGWVELSAKKFLPEVCSRLEGIQIVSARTQYETESCQNPIEWKMRAFLTVARAHVSAFGPDPSLISVGDSVHERVAALRAWPLISQEGASPLVKCLKLPEQPGIATLGLVQDMLQATLATLVAHPSNLDLCLLPESNSEASDPPSRDRVVDV